MLSKRENMGATNSDRHTSGSGEYNGAELDGQIKLELCLECKEYKRTVVEGVCYDCNYTKLPVNVDKIRKYLPIVDDTFTREDWNDKELDIIIELINHTYKSQALIEEAYANMSDLRKFRDFHNQNADDMMERELNREILSGVGKR